MFPVIDDLADGKLCFEFIDCFAWGSWSGTQFPSGPPFCALPAPTCGNGTLEALEHCDDGNTSDDGNGCTADFRRNDAVRRRQRPARDGCVRLCRVEEKVPRDDGCGSATGGGPWWVAR